MGMALRVYEQLTEAGEDTARAHILAEAFDVLEQRYPPLDALATREQLSETELRLRKDIETLRMEIKELELRIVTRMGEFKVETLKWVAGMMLVQTGILIGVLMGGLRMLAP